MSKASSVWEAWTLSQTLRVRPSEIYHIKDPLTAYYFDRAVVYFGRTVEDDMRQAAEKGKTPAARQMAARRQLAFWLHDDPNTIPKGVYRDPMAER